MGLFILLRAKQYSHVIKRALTRNFLPAHSTEKKLRKTFITVLASLSLAASLAVGITPAYAASCGPSANPCPYTAMTFTLGGMPATGAPVVLPLDSIKNVISNSNNGTNNVYIQWGDGAANLVSGSGAGGAPTVNDVGTMSHTYGSTGPFSVTITEASPSSLVAFGIGPTDAGWASTYSSTHTRWTGAQYLRI